MQQQTSKNTSYSIESLSEQIENCGLRIDHPLQRPSGVWSLVNKSNLISDILQGNMILSIIISEQLMNNIVVNWLIDGLQRLSTMHYFLRDGFRISPKVKRYMISYNTVEKDENGKVIKDEYGNPVYKTETIDIRRKKYSELPRELQRKFLDYTVPVIHNLNCDKDQISYDMARFNQGRVLTKSQVGIMSLDEDLACTVNNIYRLDIFRSSRLNSYTEANMKNSELKRAILETAMITHFRDKWMKNAEKISSFLNAQDMNVFTDTYLLLEKLSDSVDERSARFFTAKDSFILFATFDTFLKYTEDGKKYVDFLLWVDSEKKSMFEEFGNKSNKDKNVLFGKLDLYEELIKEYLGVEDDGESEDDLIDEAVKILAYSDIARESSLTMEEAQDICNNLSDDTLKNMENVTQDIQDIADDVEGFKFINKHNLLGFIEVYEKYGNNAYVEWFDDLPDDFNGDVSKFLAEPRDKLDVS